MHFLDKASLDIINDDQLTRIQPQREDIISSKFHQFARVKKEKALAYYLAYPSVARIFNLLVY